MSTLITKEERFTEVASEMFPLWIAHWNEIAEDRNEIPLYPDLKRYAELEKGGALLTLTVRDGEKLVGYCIMFLTHHIHYSKTLFAINDVLYLDPAYRSGTNGIKLIKDSERLAKDIGVTKITWHIKTNHNFGKILERMGYKMFEVNYGKLLGD